MLVIIGPHKWITDAIAARRALRVKKAAAVGRVHSELLRQAHVRALPAPHAPALRMQRSGTLFGAVPFL
jgi:hypothetical protein